MACGIIIGHCYLIVHRATFYFYLKIVSGLQFLGARVGASLFITLLSPSSQLTVAFSTKRGSS